MTTYTDAQNRLWYWMATQGYTVALFCEVIGDNS